MILMFNYSLSKILIGFRNIDLLIFIFGKETEEDEKKQKVVTFAEWVMAQFSASAHETP